jgi:drug/metabolite transporter (DMT)-like permease
VKEKIMTTATTWMPDFVTDASPATKGIALGLGAALIWGSYLAMARAGVSAGLHASDVAFLRYATAGLILLPWFLRAGAANAAGVGWGRAAFLALLVGPPFILIGVGGYAFAPLAHGAAIQPATLTLGATLMAVWLAGDRPGPMRWAGLGAMIVGIVLVAGPSALAGGADTWKGDAMFAVAGLMWAAFSVLAKRWSLSPMQATAAVSVLSAAVYTPLYLAGDGWARLMTVDPTMLAAQIVVQGGLSGVVAVLAFTRAVQLLGPGKAALFPALVPATAVIIGIPVAGEIPAAIQIAGIALATIGLSASVWRR